LAEEHVINQSSAIGWPWCNTQILVLFSSYFTENTWSYFQCCERKRGLATQFVFVLKYFA